MFSPNVVGFVMALLLMRRLFMANIMMIGRPIRTKLVAIGWTIADLILVACIIDLSGFSWLNIHITLGLVLVIVLLLCLYLRWVIRLERTSYKFLEKNA